MLVKMEKRRAASQERARSGVSNMKAKSTTCKACGSALEPNLKFCPYCGIPIPEAPRFRARTLLIACILLFAVSFAGAAGCVLFLQGGGSAPSSQKSGDRTVAYAELDTEGNAYLLLADGSVETISGDVSTARLTASQAYLITLRNKVLSYTELSSGTETEIARDADSIIAVRDTGIIYENKGGFYFRYCFDGDEAVKLGTVSKLSTASNTLSVAFACPNGDIRILPQEADTPETIGSYENDVSMRAVSDDGETAVWVDFTSVKETVFLYDAGQVSELGKMTASGSSYANTAAFFSKNGQVLVIYNTEDKTMFLKNGREAPMEVRLGDCLASSAFYTSSGPLSRDDAPISGIYLLAEDSDRPGNILYWVPTASGKRERVATGISSFTVADGMLFYTDADDTLFCGAVKEAVLEEPHRVDSHVYDFTASTDGKYLYYSKDFDDDLWEAPLYGYRVGDDAPVPIADSAYVGLRLSPDGQSVFYLTGETELTDSYDHYGTLIQYNLKTGKETILDTDVLRYSYTSNLASNCLDPNGFVYTKFLKVDADENVLGDWYYYSGGESRCVAKNLIS